MSAALYAAREGIEILIIERSGVDGQAGTTERIDNYPGFAEGIGRAELADDMRAHAERFDVEILPAQAVTEIESQGDYKMIATESGDSYCGRSVLLTPGATYRRLNVPGEDNLIGAGIHICETCDGPFYKGKELVVVGGGNSGSFPHQVRHQSDHPRGRRPAQGQPDSSGESGQSPADRSAP